MGYFINNRKVRFSDLEASGIYSCYRMDETLAPLNGAETKLTLWVK